MGAGTSASDTPKPETAMADSPMMSPDTPADPAAPKASTTPAAPTTPAASTTPTPPSASAHAAAPEGPTAAECAIAPEGPAAGGMDVPGAEARVTASADGGVHGEEAGESLSGGSRAAENGKVDVGTAGTEADEETAATSRRFSAVTLDTARPEGGGRAAPPDAPAPARQWPLLSVLGTAGLGLLIVGTHPFDEAFRIGTILVGIALMGGAVLRRVLPSVGMLAVRSRFTDMVTYGLLGVVIVLLALMTQPRPWLEIPFLEDIVHSTVP